MSRRTRTFRRSVLLGLAPALLSVPPAGAAARDLFVSSRNTHSVKRFDGETGAFLGNFVTRGSGGLNTTQDLAWGPDGHLYVTGIGNTAVLRFDGATGDFLGEFTSGRALDQPTKISFRPDGFLYVSQWGGGDDILRFRASEGVFQDQFTDGGIVNGCGQAWDSAGRLYVAYWGTDGNDGGVRWFDAAGNDLGDFDQGGVLKGPVNVWLDGEGLLVADWTTGRVERLDATGQPAGTLVSGLTNLEGFTYGPDGRLYLCDWTANVVNRYEPDGTPLGGFAIDGNLSHPNACVFGLAGPVEAPVRHLPDAGMRLECAPDPFREATSIRFALASGARVTLRVLDVAGREVIRLLDTDVPAGEHRVSWSPGHGPAGIYFVNLDAGGRSLSRRLTRLR